MSCKAPKMHNILKVFVEPLGSPVFLFFNPAESYKNAFTST